MILDDAHHDTPPTWGFSPNDQVGERGLRDGPAMEAMAHFDEKSMALHIWVNQQQATLGYPADSQITLLKTDRGSSVHLEEFPRNRTPRNPAEICGSSRAMVSFSRKTQQLGLVTGVRKKMAIGKSWLILACNSFRG